MRALAAAGRHDEEIAEILNADGMRTGRGLAWNTWAVRWTRKKERICRVAPDRPRRELLPDQHAVFRVTGAIPGLDTRHSSG